MPMTIGERGEHIVSKILPKATRVFEKPGHDFILPNDQKLEVKCTYGSMDKIVLFTRPRPEKREVRVWSNSIADHLLVLTRKSIYLIRAADLRSFIESNPPSPSARHKYRFPLKLKTVVEKGLAVEYPRANFKDVEASRKFLNEHFGVKVA